jgi:hypothetical protein
VFFPFLRKHFPKHLARYQRSFRDGAYLNGSYPDKMRDLVRDIRLEAGLLSRDMDSAPPSPPAEQMLLF